MFMPCRWRDVKLRALENADHRTYVDLKVDYFFPSFSMHQVPFDHQNDNPCRVTLLWSYLWLWLVWYCPYDYFGWYHGSFLILQRFSVDTFLVHFCFMVIILMVFVWVIALILCLFSVDDQFGYKGIGVLMLLALLNCYFMWIQDKWKTLVHTATISPQQRRGDCCGVH